MGRADIALPGAATQMGVIEPAFPHGHFQDHIAVIANEALERDGASAAAGEAVAVSDVTVVGQLAGATADRASGGFVSDGGHGWFLNEERRRS